MLAVAGGKGGCGKTTTTLGLTRAAASTGRSPLAVDADVDMPDLHRVAGVETGPPGEEPTPVPLPDADAAVLPAPPGTSSEQRRRRLSTLHARERPVFVDCPAGAGRDAAAPMRVADRTLVVTTPDPAAVRDAAKTAAMSRAVGTPVAGGVVTHADTVPEGVERLLEAPPLGALPPRCTAFDGARANRRFSRLLARLPEV